MESIISTINMNIETTEDLATQLADWLGIYGSCKNITASDDNCTYDPYTNPFCCRIGFMAAIQERMIEAVANDKKLEQAGLAQ